MGLARSWVKVSWAPDETTSSKDQGAFPDSILLAQPRQLECLLTANVLAAGKRQVDQESGL